MYTGRLCGCLLALHFDEEFDQPYYGCGHIIVWTNIEVNVNLESSHYIKHMLILNLGIAAEDFHIN